MTVGVGDHRVEMGRCERTIVENAVRARQLHGGKTVCLTTQHQRCQVHIVVGVDVAALQRVMHKVVQVIHAHDASQLDGDGVQGLAQGVVHQHDIALAARVAVVAGPVAPDVVARLCLCGQRVDLADVGVLQYLVVGGRVQRQVLNGRGVGDLLVVQRQTVGSDGLHGRTGLVGQQGAVGTHINGLFAQTAGNAQHVAVIVQHGDACLRAHFFVHAEVDGVIVGVVGVGGFADLQLGVGFVGVNGYIVGAVHGVAVLGDGQTGGFVILHHIPGAGFGGVVAQADGFLVPHGGDQTVLVQHGFLDGSLHAGVHGGLNAQAAGEDQLLRFLLGVAEVVDQLAAQRGVQRVGKPGVVGAAGRAALGGAAFHNGQRLVAGGIVLALGDVALVKHLVQNVIAAAQQVFGVGKGVVARGVFTDGCQHGALGKAQLADILVKVGVGARLHTVDNAGQRDGVEVGFEDGVLAVALGKTQRAENFAHFTQGVGFVVLGQVFDELLLQRGRALLRAEQCVVGQHI